MAYTTLQNIQDEIKATAPFSSDTFPSQQAVQRWISEADAVINQLSGNMYAQSTYVEEINYEGEDRIILKHAPIISVTSVEYSPYAIGTPDYPSYETKVEDTDYTVFNEKGYIEPLASWSPRSGSKQIKITYVAGYEDTPATIQMLSTKMVAKRVIDSVMAKDLNERQSGKSITAGSISIVKPSNYGVQSYKNLLVDIDEISKKLIEGTRTYRFINY